MISYIFYPECQRFHHRPAGLPGVERSVFTLNDGASAERPDAESHARKLDQATERGDGTRGSEERHTQPSR